MKTAVLALGAAAAAWALLRRSDAVTEADGEVAQEVDPEPYSIELPSLYTNTLDFLMPAQSDQAAANEAAFLLTIRTAEGTAGPNGYRTLFGGSLFSGFSDHPRQAMRYGDLWTSAAGAYQFMAISPLPYGRFTKVNTWDRIKQRLGLPDFSPESQDLAALELIREAGAAGDVRAGRFDEAIRKVRGIWASLPGAGYGQPEKSLATLRTAYLNAGGALA